MSELDPVPSIPSGHEQVVCSLFEGHYHLGVATFINSTVRAGFRGLFWMGCRGQLPPWTSRLERREDGLFRVGDALLGFETIQGSRHLAQYKPEFLLSLIDRGISSKYVWYFDPDITVRCDWDFFERWARYGVCLCQEVTMGTMPSRHPYRCEWTDLARAAGWGEPVNQQERYFNSGFVGMDIAQRAFPQQWTEAILLANRSGVDPGDFRKRRRFRAFAFGDQDALNLATMYAAVPLTTMGPEAMGFIYGGFTMYHSVGNAKPWNRKFITDALRGIAPTPAEKHFLTCAAGPIEPFSRAALRRSRACIATASFITRFWRAA